MPSHFRLEDDASVDSKLYWSGSGALGKFEEHSSANFDPTEDLCKNTEVEHNSSISDAADDEDLDSVIKKPGITIFSAATATPDINVADASMPTSSRISSILRTSLPSDLHICQAQLHVIEDSIRKV